MRSFLIRMCKRRGLVLIAVIACCNAATQSCAQVQPPALPFAGTDVVVLHGKDGAEERFGGTIQEISGNRLTMRRNGRGEIRILRMSNVTQISFSRSSAWEDGLKLFSDGNYAEALLRFDHALDKERRPWAWCELQATAAKTSIRLRRYSKAVSRIEEIVKQDERTRHVSVLPLVWDATLPEDERLTADRAELRSESIARRLAAGSALLHMEQHRAAAAAALEEIRKEEGLTAAGELARCQLWRLHLLEKPTERNPILQVWADRVREMPVNIRYGPRYVVAQGYLQHHDYDRAALAFLWMPVMASHDEPLAAQSLVHAIRCLKLAGRVAEAQRMTGELHLRFADTSAERQFAKQESD